MEHYDVLVSGAGPAGALAAYLSAKANYSTLLVERSEIPRQKCCAGGLLGRAEGLLEFAVPDEIIRRRIDSIGVVIDGNRETFKTGRTIAATVDRGEFDSFLAHKAQDAGAELVTKERVSGLDEKADHITALIGGKQIKARAAIIAEGAASANANQLFGARPSGYTAIGAMAQFTASGPISSSLDFYLFDTPTKNVRFGRYFPVNGWMFPHQNGGNIGVAGTGLRQNTINGYLKLIEDDMRSSGARMTVGPTSIRPIPFRPRRKLYSKRCLAIGDSAGFANPISGEGMTYAFLSARFASESIDELLEGDVNTLAGYQRQCENRIHRDLIAASLIGPVAHWLVGVVDTKRFLKVLHEHDQVVETAISIADGRNDWRSLFLRMIPEFFPLFFSSLPSSKDHDQSDASEQQPNKSDHHGRP
jgi:geranylgeranyl reductase family protein